MLHIYTYVHVITEQARVYESVWRKKRERINLIIIPPKIKLKQKTRLKILTSPMPFMLACFLLFFLTISTYFVDILWKDLRIPPQTGQQEIAKLMLTTMFFHDREQPTLQVC